MGKLDSEKQNIAFAFDKIAQSYDRANRFISIGMDQRWRNLMVSQITTGHPLRVLDIACGTCDSAIAALQHCPNIDKLIGLDASAGMLQKAREKVEISQINKIELVQGDMLDLPYGDNYFDCVTIVFGLRNAPDTVKAIREAARVVKNGGQCLFLEFSMPENVFFRPLYYFYLRYLMPLLAFLVSGKYSEYEYLFRSVKDFYKPREVVSMMKEASLECKLTSMAGGAVWLYSGKKYI